MKKRYSAASVIAVAALAFGVIAGAPAQAASKEIVIWADETRGPNLEKLMSQKSDWVRG